MLDKNLLLRVLEERILKKHPELKHYLYAEFNRRYEVLEIALKYVKPSAQLLEVGATPFLLSAMFSLVGYEVVALGIEPEEYIDVATMFKVRVFKCDLERDDIASSDESSDKQFCLK